MKVHVSSILYGYGVVTVIHALLTCKVAKQVWKLIDLKNWHPINLFGVFGLICLNVKRDVVCPFAYLAWASWHNKNGWKVWYRNNGT